ncbi:type IV pilus modification protein PilV [Billgrantia kenyensis]|uniref:type IV pilus modification protein PilV n=1 Tax=Billgrantia kenyensis TaxID=321266 RepID=UPI001EEFFF35|nr:type IV pilus modification protein PilV [Halomonas kenyensis]
MCIGKRQHGFTLIEALIALVVLSVGLLGVAAMQLKALQSAHAGYQRALVSLMAIDAQERTWALMSQDPNKSCSVNVESEWKVDWGSVLDLSYGLSEVQAGSCEYEVEITWADQRFIGEGDVAFQYVFRLPSL